MRKYFITILAFFMLCGFAVITNAQTDSDFDLMQRAQMVAEIKELRAKNTGLTTQVVELKAQVNVYDKLNGVQESRIADLKEALKFRTDANNIDVKIENLYKSQINDYKVENLRLRDENASLRKSRDRRGLIFGIIGLVAGKFAF